MDLKKIKQEGDRVLREMQRFASALPMPQVDANNRYQPVYIKFEEFQDAVYLAKRKARELEQQLNSLDSYRKQVERNF